MPNKVLQTSKSERNLPEHWRKTLYKYVIEKDPNRDYMVTAEDTTNITLFMHMDGTICLYPHSFFIKDEKINEVLIVTEHNGSFVCSYFPIDNHVQYISYDDFRSIHNSSSLLQEKMKQMEEAEDEEYENAKEQSSG